jgi:dihydroorotase-like cyclic amidohydrolase
MKADIVIKNGLVCTKEEIVPGGLAAKDGIIIAVGPDDSLPEADKEYDAKGLLIMPGIIEPHCHLGIDRNEDFTPKKPTRFYEDILTESKAAVVGGVTTINTTIEIDAHYDMEGNKVTGLYNRIENAKPGLKNAYCDIRFYQGVANDDEVEEFNRLRKDRMMSSTKVYLGYKGAAAAVFGHPEQGYTTDFLYRALKKIAGQTGPVRMLVHCEDPFIMDMVGPEYEGEKPVCGNYIDLFNRSHPGFCETMDLCKIAYIGHYTGCPLYIVHISAKETVDQLEYFHSKGFDILGETCLHYLMFSTDDAIAYENPEWNKQAKVNPPIRTRVDRDALWEGIRKGTITVIGTDHVAYSSWMNALGKGTFWDATPGCGDGMSYLMSAMFSEGVNKRHMSVLDFVKLMSENPARAHGMYPQKGGLHLGADCDVVLFDPQKEWTVDSSKTYSSHVGSLYEGMTFKGKPMATFVRGTLVAQDGKVVIDEPCGKYVKVSELDR